MGNITGLYVCPTCSRSISFVSTVNNISICTCGEVWERRDEELERLFIPFISHPDEYIQPGTSGSWNGKRFMVTGRFRAWFEETAFNYWSIDMGDNIAWYLGEGFGLYAIYELLPAEALDRHALSLLKSSGNILLGNNSSFELIRKNKCSYLDIEGSFYKPGKGHRVSTYEAVSGPEKIEIFEYDPEEIKAYRVHPVAADTLQLSHTRNIITEGQNFECIRCKHKNTVSTYPYAQSWVCGNCGTRYALETSRQAKLAGNNTDRPVQIHIETGTKLHFNTIEFSVIGIALKQDTGPYNETWREYTLYNKIHGYAFLTESDGHWMLLKETINTPTLEDSRKESFYYNGKAFELFLRYSYRILHAKGEFPGNIFNDTHAVRATDFIAQPDIWSVEQNEKEGLTWYYGQYIDKDIIEKQLDIKLPVSKGIAPAQEKMKADMPAIMRAVLIALAALLLVQYGTDLSNNKKVILSQTYTLSDSTVTQTFVTDKFELRKWKSNLRFEIEAPVDNSWFELGATLVNAKTGDEYSLEQGVEYYHGYSGGESWSEGDTDEDAYLSSIPAGTYFLQINSNREMGLAKENEVKWFTIKVTNDSPMYRNFWIILLLLLTWPVLMLILNSYYEKKRWQASPYSKYT